MSEDADVFNKLSRIISTHDHMGADDPHMDRIASALDFSDSPGKAGGKRRAAASKPPVVSLPDRPTPYEVWHAKHEGPKSKKVGSTKLSSSAMDIMISKMHQSNRLKHDETIRVQNEGLKQELQGFEFKPRINKTSKELAATMKPIAERMPEMVAEKERILTRKREDRDRDEMATCAFQPTRIGAKMSDKYLKKMGRSAKARPEDFFAYQAEKVRRNEQRRQIIDNIEARELIFTPQLPASSRRMHESMTTNPANKTIYDPVSRTTTVIRSPKVVSRRTSDGSVVHDSTIDLSNHIYGQFRNGDGDENDLLIEGPPLLLESDHPYKHNLDEYTSVAVPGALRYTITFDDETSTEPVHDFVRFLKYDNQSVVLGAGKYTGGMLDAKGPRTNALTVARTSFNWPGIGKRHPLVINASKFVVHFKTNGKLNDWGFRMSIIPTISSAAAEMEPKYRADSFRPQISSKGASYGGPSGGGGKVPIHERLYKDAMNKRAADQNKIAAIFSGAIKDVEVKPWEMELKSGTGGKDGSHKSWMQDSRTHVGKNLLGPALNDLLILDEDDRVVTVAETKSVSERDIWISMQAAQPLQTQASMLGGTGVGSYRGEENSMDPNVASQLDFNRLRMSDF